MECQPVHLFDFEFDLLLYRASTALLECIHVIYRFGFNTEIANGGKYASIEAGCPCEPSSVAITPGPLPVFVPP